MNRTFCVIITLNASEFLKLNFDFEIIIASCAAVRNDAEIPALLLASLQW